MGSLPTRVGYSPHMATALDIAKDLRAQAATLIEAANVLDPPKLKRRRRTKLEITKAQQRGNGRKRFDSPKEKLKLDLGTRGRTSHPTDPDAQALAESLVHTTEAPK